MKTFINNILDLIKKKKVIERHEDGEWIHIKETKHLLFGCKTVYEKCFMRSNPSISHDECYYVNSNGTKKTIWRSTGL